MESRQSKKILKRNSKVESYEISWQNLQRDSFTPVPTQSGITSNKGDMFRLRDVTTEDFVAEKCPPVGTLVRLLSQFPEFVAYFVGYESIKMDKIYWLNICNFITNGGIKAIEMDLEKTQIKLFKVMNSKVQEIYKPKRPVTSTGNRFSAFAQILEECSMAEIQSRLWDADINKKKEAAMFIFAPKVQEHMVTRYYEDSLNPAGRTVTLKVAFIYECHTTPFERIPTEILHLLPEDYKKRAVHRVLIAVKHYQLTVQQIHLITPQTCELNDLSAEFQNWQEMTQFTTRNPDIELVEYSINEQMTIFGRQIYVPGQQFVQAPQVSQLPQPQLVQGNIEDFLIGGQQVTLILDKYSHLNNLSSLCMIFGRNYLCVCCRANYYAQDIIVFECGHFACETCCPRLQSICFMCRVRVIMKPTPQIEHEIINGQTPFPGTSTMKMPPRFVMPFTIPLLSRDSMGKDSYLTALLEIEWLDKPQVIQNAVQLMNRVPVNDEDDVQSVSSEDVNQMMDQQLRLGEASISRWMNVDQ